jgi:hypothetical protein
LTKPFNDHVLLSAIPQAIERSHSRRPILLHRLSGTAWTLAPTIFIAYCDVSG